MISRRIIELVNLALKDYVLTDKERGVIVSEALKEGASFYEINSFINQKLKEANERKPKELLKNCPVCGGQIPLISNSCKYCNNVFDTDSQSFKKQNFFGGYQVAESIIESENLRIEEERYNKRECPDCGAPFPLFGRICGFCGYIFHDLPEKDENIITLTQSMLSQINKIKNIRIVLTALFNYHRPILVGLMAVPFMAIAGSTDNDFFMFLVLFLIVFAAIKGAIVHTKQSPTKIASEQLSSAFYMYQSYERQVQALYPNDKEARQMLTNLKKTMESKRLEKQLKNMIVIIIFTLAFAIATFIGFSIALNLQSEMYNSNKNQYKELYSLMNKEAILEKIESKSKDLESIVVSNQAILKLEWDGKKISSKLINEQTPFCFCLYNVRIINKVPICRDSICMVAHIYNKDKIEITPNGKYKVVIQCVDSSQLLGDRYYNFRSINNYSQNLTKDFRIMLDSAKYFSIELSQKLEGNGK